MHYFFHHTNKTMKKILFLCFILHSPLVLANFYNILGVSNDCSQENIKHGYKRMIGAFHPDFNKAPDATKRSQEINEAYRVLSDPTLRAEYDRSINLKEDEQRASRERGNSTTKQTDNESREETTEKPNSNNHAKTDTMNDGNILHFIIQRATNTFDLSSTINKSYEKYIEQENKVFQKVSVILEKDINLDAINSQRKTSLSLSVQKQMLRVAYLLLVNNAKPEIQDEDGNNTLHLISMEQRIWLEKQLEQLDPFLRTHSKKEITFFGKIYNKHKRAVLALAKAIIERAHRTNLLTAPNNKRELPLHTTIRYQFPELAELIIEALEQERTVDWNAQNNLQETYFALTIKKRLPRIAHLLLDNNAKPEIPDKDGNNGLHLIALKMEPFKYYPETDYNVDKSKTVILALTRNVIKTTQGTDLLMARNNQEKLPVQLAMSNFPELAELIIELGGDKGLTEEERDFLIQEAIKKDWLQIIRLLRKENSRQPNLLEKSCWKAFKSQ